MAAEIPLTVAIQRSPLDARRGIVRVSPVVFDTLRLQPWDPLVVAGRRITGALAAAAPPEMPQNTILLDDLTCTNAGVGEGEQVLVAAGNVGGAESIALSRLPDGIALQADTIRLALLGKVVTAGDMVALLPQDFTRSPQSAAVLDVVVGSLQQTYGRDWQRVVLNVDATIPAGLVRITMETHVELDGQTGTSSSSTPMAPPDKAPLPSDLPGLESQLDRLTELLDLCFHHRDVLARLGSSPALGVLISGLPGSGKGALVNAVAAQVGARVHRVWGPAIARLDADAARRKLEKLFEQARSTAPAVIMIEDVEAVAPRESPGPLTSVLTELIQQTASTGTVAVLCTTAHPETTSQNLRAHGVLDHELEIPLPHRSQRLRILEVHTRPLPLAPDVSLDAIAAATPGYVAADLIALAREAALRAAQRAAAAEGGISPFVLGEDFKAALEVVKPSALDGATVEVAQVELEDVGDMEATKKELTEAVIWPLRYPDTFDRLGVDPICGVLLYGPPGCGKTHLVKALVHEAEANFLSVKGAELLSKWVGESERAVRELFRRARSAAPALIFFDEIDALAPVRGGSHDSGATDRMVAQLLTELDGIEELRGVFVVGATNRPDLIDPALLRPGRLERLVYVPPPDAAARAAILGAVARRMPLAPGLDLAGIAWACEGYSAADLEGLARRAAIAAMHESMEAPAITGAHFEAARGEVRPSLRADQVAALERFATGRSRA